MGGPRRHWRSVAAIVGGIVPVAALSIAVDALMHTTGVFPPWGEAMSEPLFVLASAYRNIFGIGGGYIAARLAPYRPMAHALTLGTLGLIVSLAGTVVTWEKS